jgi:hypothetical protein
MGAYKYFYNILMVIYLLESISMATLHILLVLYFKKLMETSLYWAGSWEIYCFVLNLAMKVRFTIDLNINRS